MEIVLALGIMSFCVVALLALFSIGINSGRDSQEELTASHLVQGIIGSRRSAPAADLGSEFPLPALVAGGSKGNTVVLLGPDGRIAASSSEARYALKYRIEAPAAGETKPFNVYLCAYWPAQGALASASGRYELAVTFPAP